MLECSGCGATLAFRGSALSLRCSYCDSPMIDEERAGASLERVIPFAVPERGALDHVRTFLEGRWLAPADLSQVRIHARGLRAVLVPMWAYRGVVRSEYRAQVGLHWYEEIERRDKAGNKVTKQALRTEWFALGGSSAWQVEDHLISASVGLGSDETAALGRYDLGRALDYDPRVLAGVEAELPSVSGEHGDLAAVEELRRLERNRLVAELLPGDRNRLDHIDTKVRLDERQLVLVPVWIATYRYRDRVRRVLVNGQTGLASGSVPLDRVKVAALVLAGLALVGLLWWLAHTLEVFA